MLITLACHGIYLCVYIYIYTYIYIYIHACTHAYIYRYIQADRQTDRRRSQAARPAGRQTDRQTGRHIYISTGPACRLVATQGMVANRLQPAIQKPRPKALGLGFVGFKETVSPKP